MRGKSFPAWYADHPGDIDDGAIGFGIDAVGGLEFFFEKIPFAISFELKPFLNLPLRIISGYRLIRASG
ncbi:MAG: hypothetical protein ACOCWA_05215 [Bacteroidota bacterium]